MIYNLGVLAIATIFLVVALACGIVRYRRGAWVFSLLSWGCVFIVCGFQMLSFM